MVDTACCGAGGGGVVQDEKEEEDGGDLGTLKAMMAANWVEPSKRERKRIITYNEADYFKTVRRRAGEGGGGGMWVRGGGKALEVEVAGGRAMVAGKRWRDSFKHSHSVAIHPLPVTALAPTSCAPDSHVPPPSFTAAAGAASDAGPQGQERARRRAACAQDAGAAGLPVLQHQAADGAV